ncbi:MAG: hypothetical protein JSW06_08550 [Thermoplasmatales archaeon]|nr:MAG: hypothetical protein JSW06_08550 [Thermoplasmatales archaeon]
MLIMGTNSWEKDIPKEPLVKQALKFAELVKAQGIAELREAYISPNQKLMWCTWETENLEALQDAFTEMNEQSGLKSELRPVEDMCSE